MIVGGLTVPCVAVVGCRGRVLALQHLQAMPPYMRLAFAVWVHRWWAVGVLGVGVVAFGMLCGRLGRSARWRAR